jgi:hypothetical protein
MPIHQSHKLYSLFLCAANLKHALSGVAIAACAQEHLDALESRGVATGPAGIRRAETGSSACKTERGGKKYLLPPRYQNYYGGLRNPRLC